VPRSQEHITDAAVVTASAERPVPDKQYHRRAHG
jgi:hypothetical protein